MEGVVEQEFYCCFHTSKSESPVLREKVKTDTKLLQRLYDSLVRDYSGENEGRDE